MHERNLPRFHTLGAYLFHLESMGRLDTIRVPVSMRLEITEIHRRVVATGGPALRLTQPLDQSGLVSNLPVVTNLFGTVERVAWGLGTDVEGLARLGELLAWMRSPQPPQNLKQFSTMLPAARRAFQTRPKIVSATKEWKEAEPDFSFLPVQTCWPGDAGPLITWPIVVTRPPGDDDFSAYNLGIYRMQVIDRDRAILRWLPMRGGAAHHRTWQARGLEMPVAVVIGADPATLLASVMPAPEGVSELALSGMISDRRVRMVV